MIIPSLVRPHIEHSSGNGLMPIAGQLPKVVKYWSPYYKKDTKSIEGVETSYQTDYWYAGIKL